MPQFKSPKVALARADEPTRRLAIIEVATRKMRLVRPMPDEIVFGSEYHQRSPGFWLAMCGWVFAFTWFMVLLYLFSH